MANFIRNLRFAHKFLVIAIVAAVMLLVPTAIFIRADMDVVTNARREVQGLAPAQETLKLIQLSQQHRGMSAVVLAGNEAQASARQAKEGEVNQAMGKVQASLADLGDARLKASLEKLAGDWKSLASAVGAKSIPGPESFARHTALIAEELGLLEDIVNATGIALDPTAAGYYLQLAVLQHMPRVTEGLGQIRARGSALLVKAAASPEDKVRIEALGAGIRNNMASARKALGLAIQAHPALQGQMGDALTKAAAATDDAMALVNDKIVRADTLNYPSGEYFGAMTKAIDVQFALINAAFDALRAQLQATVGKARTELYVGGALVALMAVLGGWLMVLITRTTTSSVRAAVGLAQEVAKGDLDHRFSDYSRDEMGDLLKALGDMQDSLAKVVTTVRVDAEGVATASAEIAQGNNDMSARTESQASALEETAASMEELNGTVHRNAESASQANQLALTHKSVI